MNIRKFVLAGMAGAGLVVGGISIAQAPIQNVDPHRHPNLAAAQRLCVQAYNALAAAQQANEADMSGHAQKAKDLLTRASFEIKAAAEHANRP